MLDPRFKTLHLVSLVIGGEQGKTIVQKYDNFFRFQVWLLNIIIICIHSLNQKGALMPAGSGSYIMLWEPDHFFNPSVYICEFVRTEEVFKKFISPKLNRLSNMVILAYLITINFHNPLQFSFFLHITISLLFII
jgi:hypothetical protein